MQNEPLSNFLPSASIESMVKMSSKSKLEDVVAIIGEARWMKARVVDHRHIGLQLIAICLTSASWSAFTMHRLYWGSRKLYAPLRRATFRTLVTSSLVIRNPPEAAFRHAPTPLVFVSAKDWDRVSTER